MQEPKKRERREREAKVTAAGSLVLRSLVARSQHCEPLCVVCLCRCGREREGGGKAKFERSSQRSTLCVCEILVAAAFLIHSRTEGPVCRRITQQWARTGHAFSVTTANGDDGGGGGGVSSNLFSTASSSASRLEWRRSVCIPMVPGTTSA